MPQRTELATITVPIPDHRELAVGTLLSIIRQSRVPRSRFIQGDMNALRALAPPRLRRGMSEWFFPSPTSRSGHLEEPKKAWQRIRARANTKDVRIHDLRRTLGSWLAASGYGLPMIGRVLNHSQPSATAVYARLDLEPVRRALEANAQAMLEVERSGTAELAKNVTEAADDEGRSPDRRQPTRKGRAQRARAPRLARVPAGRRPAPAG